MRVMLLPYGALAGVAAVLACDSEQITAGERQDIVAAFRDAGTEFDVIATYALPDSVVHLTTDRAAETPSEITRDLDDRILARVRMHLDGRGYDHEPEPHRNPIDVVVLVSAIATPNFTSWANYPWFDWWGFFPGFGLGPFDPTWGIEYPWSDEAIAFNYDIGTILIEMIDVRSIDEPSQQVNAVWSGAVNGILTPATEAEESRIMIAIDEVFALSPYLGREP